MSLKAGAAAPSIWRHEEVEIEPLLAGAIAAGLAPRQPRRRRQPESRLLAGIPGPDPAGGDELGWGAA